MRKSNTYTDRGRRSLPHVALVGLSIAMLSVACGGENKADGQGAVGQGCYDDGTCDQGLSCISDVCTTGIPSTVDPDAGVPLFSDARSNTTTPDRGVASFPDASDDNTEAPDGGGDSSNDAGDSTSNDAEPPIADAEVPCTGPGCEPCVPGCTAGDLPRCVGVRQQVCGNHDTDTCLEWSAGTPKAECVFFEDPREGDWGTCSEVCGPGEQTATRKCVDLTRNPAPDQALCNGNPVDTRPCNVVACSVGIKQQPTSASAALGGEVTFTVVGQGLPAPTYQWHTRPAGSATNTPWTVVQGQTKPTMTVAGATLMYRSEFMVVVTNKTGHVNSAIVKVLPELKEFDIVNAMEFRDYDCGETPCDCGAGRTCARRKDPRLVQLTADKLCQLKTELSNSGAAGSTRGGVDDVYAASWWNGNGWAYDRLCKRECAGYFTSVTCYK